MPSEFKIDEQVIPFLRCPVTKSPLRVASAELVSAINARIAAGDQVNRLGESVKQELGGGLINEEETILLPVRGGILNLVVDQAIELDAGS